MMNRREISTYSRSADNSVNANSIELQDKGEVSRIHITPEENRKVISREMKNLQYILSGDSKITKYSWESDGEKIFNDGGKVYFNREEKKILKYLLLQKIPEKHRTKLWLIASGAKREIMNNKDYYYNLTRNFPETIPSPYENQIDMDLYRTFPGDPYFTKEENIAKLKNILLAYSRRNISVGYCQGFNFIAGRLLKIFKSEEEAFWVFVQLIEHILPINYYSELAGIMVDCAILLNLIKGYLPNVYNHLVEIGYEMSLSNVLYKWFVSLFIQNLSSDLSLVIWDMLMLEGNIVLFKATIGILKILKNSILSKSSLEDINYIFDEETRHLNDHSVLVYYLILQKFEFDIEFIYKNRIVFQSTILESIINNNNYRKNKYIEEERNWADGEQYRRRASYVKNVVECFREWPLCIYDLGYKYNVITYLVFKVHDPPNFIENYYSENKKSPGMGIHTKNKEVINKKKNLPSMRNNNNSFFNRKSSRSSEGFQKIQLDNSSDCGSYCHLQGLINQPILNVHQHNQSSNNSPKQNYNHMDFIHFESQDEMKMEVYKTLLIERRQHICPEKELVDESIKDYDHEIILNSEFEISDSYVKVKEGDISLGLGNNSSSNGSRVEIKDMLLSRTRRSQSMIRTSHIKFPSNQVNFEDSYSKLFNNLTHTEENQKLFDTFKPKPLLEIEDYVFEENPFKK